MRLEFFEQMVHTFGCLRHAFPQHIVGVARKTEELCQFHAEIHQIATNLEVVSLVVVRTTRHVSAIKFLAQRTILGILHERSERRRMQREHPTFHSALLRRCRRLFDLRLRQTRQFLALRQMKYEIVGLFDVVLRELQREFRQFRLHFFVASSLFFRQGGSRAHKTVVGVLQKHGIFAGQRRVLLLSLVDCAHSTEQRLVEHDVRAVFAQEWRHPFGQFFQLIGRVGRK